MLYDIKHKATVLKRNLSFETKIKMSTRYLFFTQ